MRVRLLNIWVGAFWLMLCWLVLSSASAQVFPKTYDREIESAVKRWWPDLPYPKAWKAQLYQESRLDPAAVSPVGARGLAQFMPGTWNEVLGQMGRQGSPHDPSLAIEAGALYMAKLRHTWRRNRTPIDRNPLAQASYNAGTGSILKAQARCGEARMWPEIAPCLVEVTGEKFSHETRTYVARIDRWWRMMELQ